MNPFLVLVLIALLSNLGYNLDSNHVLVADMQVPEPPPWYQVGTNLGSEVGFQVSDDLIIVVAGVGYRDTPLHAWKGLQVYHCHPVQGVPGNIMCDADWFWARVYAEVPIGSNYASIKAWIDHGLLKIAYSTSGGDYRILYTYPVNGNVTIWADNCVPTIQPIGSEPSGENPVPQTQEEISRTTLMLLLGLGILAVIAIVALRR